MAEQSKSPAHLIDRSSRSGPAFSEPEAVGVPPQAELALMQDAAKFRRLFESNIVGIIVADIHGNITEANDFFLSMLGYSRDDLPLRWDAMTPPEWHALDRAKITEVVTSGVGLPWEKEYLSRDGRRVPILVGVALLEETGGDRICLVLDRTQRKQAEQQLVGQKTQLQALAAALSLAEEQERRRIAQRLHDRIGQMLAVTKGKLGALPESQLSGPDQPLVDEIRTLIDQVIETTRTLTFELSSPVLYELGLEAALQSLGERVGQQHDLRFHFETDGQPKPLADDVSVMLYRVARELLFNVVKHARARNASLVVGRVGDALRFSLEDDGVGFDPARAGERFDERGGFGFFSIRQQLDHMGGSLEIDSRSGDGTRVTVVVPLGKEAGMQHERDRLAP